MKKNNVNILLVFTLAILFVIGCQNNQQEPPVKKPTTTTSPVSSGEVPTSRTGAPKSTSQPTIPEQEVQKTVKATVTYWNEAIGMADTPMGKNAMLSFRNVMGSSNYKNTVTDEQLYEKYSEYIKRSDEINKFFKPVYNIDAVFDTPPSVSSDGRLRVKGYYPTSPKISFAIAFTQDGGRWLLDKVDDFEIEIK